jgi:hypothetical protein
MIARLAVQYWTHVISMSNAAAVSQLWLLFG